ncbi:MAG: ArnT family glycosyltransferase, partial [Bdellovibrionales bacterium]
MFDPLMVFLFLLHMGLLIGATGWVLAKRAVPVREWPLLGLVLLWGGLVFGSHFAGFVNGLNSLWVYVPASFLGLGVMVACFTFVWKIPTTKPLVPAPGFSFVTIENPKVEKFLRRFFLITLGVFGLISVVLGLSVYPDNADSMIYRLPRAVWYVSHANWLHPFISPDNRLVYYPLDGVMLYVPLVLYNLPGTVHSIPSLLSWASIVYIAYRFARELGAQRVIALFVAWLVGLTPSILAQATSTNDEIIAAAVLFCGLYMAWRWLVSGRSFYFFMAGMAVALSAGTKLHIVFLMPIIGVAALIALWYAVRKPELFRVWGNAIGWKAFFMTVAIMLVMFVPFLFYNYASTGRFYFFDDFKAQVFNLSASLHVWFQNLLIYSSQMILSPIADMNFWPVANDRQRMNTAINQIFNPLIKPFIDPNPAFYHLNYRFVGVTIPVSVRFVEFSLWSGFVWLLWPFQAALSLKQKSVMRPLFFLLAITPLFWLIFWSSVTLYMEGTATYFTFYLICAAPAVAMAFTHIQRPLLNDLRWVALVFVGATNLLICHNLVMYSGFRALPDLYYARTWPYDWLL